MAQAPHPRMHGLTHLTGGADPIPGLLPKSGTVEDVIVGTLPGAYYKLNETTGDWADSSGAGRTAGYVSRTGTVRGTPAQLDEGDGALCVTVAGAAPAAALTASNVAACTDSFFEFAGVAPFTVSALINPTLLPVEGSTFSQAICGNVTDPGSGARGWGLFILSDLFDPDHQDDPFGGAAARICFRRSSSSAAVQQATGPPITAGLWQRITGVFDGTGMGLWIDDTQVAGTTSGTVSIPGFDTFRIGDCGINEGFEGTMAPFNGLIDSVIVWDRALTGDDIAAIIAGGQPAGSQQEWVLAQDENGNPVWQQPGVTVEHGGGTPDENPVTTPGGAYSGFPANPSGWHYAAHTETAVLYDSAPARFDVPSMKWVRTPFDTVRIQRRWELTVGGQFKDAWLPDDRGLTEHARNGLLHITPEMASATVKHVIDGFFSIEYPVLDYQALPDFTGGGIIAPDQYTRAARVLNASTGVVLRRLPGSTQRRFMQWEWLNDADGMAVSVLYTVDNPFPLYPVWPARPLTLPQPYPKLSPTDSLDYYLTAAGNPGFNDGTFSLEQNLVAGDNLCLQGWQDSPWLLRFSTDHFPPWNPWPYAEVWRRRPFLSVTYTYDPDSVDHTTGRLL